MRVCDIHHDQPAVDTLSMEIDGTVMDLCEKCKSRIYAMANEDSTKESKKTFFEKVLSKTQSN